MMKPLLDLFKKIKSFEWKEDQQKSIEDLKEKLLSTHDLKFPDFTKLFEVHTDVNNFAFERVLMQEVHLISFENKKLYET